MEYIWKKKKLNVRTYGPSKKLEIRKEHALPVASYMGLKLTEMGGAFSLFVQGFVASIHGFFQAKSKIREVQTKREPVLDLSKYRFRRRNRV